MDRAKKARTPIRASITRTINEAETEMAKVPLDHDELNLKLLKLDKLLSEITEMDLHVKDAMLDENASEDDIEAEVVAIEEYEDKLRSARFKLNKIVHPPLRPSSPSQVSEYSTAASGGGDDNRKRFKLPKIELPKFNGDIKDWLNWWGQFKKIHDDKTIEEGDKFHYLVQSLVKGSKAASAIENFPVTSDNYPKAIDILRNQFGNSKVLWKFYMRELATLIQNNGPNRGKVPLFTMYHKLESQLRAVESLGNVTRDDFLCPLVESSIPPDILVAWQHSPNYGKDGSTANPPKTELDYLREFIQNEVQNENLRNMAQGCSSAQKEKQRSKKFEDEIPTIAGLHVSSTSKSCLFCGMANHETKDCRKARGLSLQEKETKLREGRACLVCFKSGHYAKNCRSNIQCNACEKKHHLVMCPNIYGFPKVKPSEAQPTAVPPPAINLSINTGVMLETLTVRLVGADNNLLTARIFLDRGAMRSFIRKSTAEMLGCKPIGAQVFGKTLLGGVQIEPKSHNLYQVKIVDLAGKVSKEMKLTEQEPFICHLPKIPDGPWIQEVKRRKIWLSDFNYSGETDIDILIGADQMSQILTNKVIHLKCGMIATQTIFGWVLMGTLPREETVGSILCSHMKDETLSNLWDLETLGIRDPIEVETETIKEEEAKKSFNQNLRRAADGRYSVGLPWVNEVQDIPSNKNVAEARTINMTRSLVSKGKFNQYHEVIKMWQEEGLIEKVQVMNVEKCHYLPHRPVFKEKSTTTPCRPVFDASCKVGRNPSLNECLYTGPNKIVFLPSVLMRFREKRIGVISDIRKAFMMISINEEDRDFLRFFWWESEKMDKLEVYRHCRVLFGVNSSPFLLAATIEHHLNNYKDGLKPIAQKLLKSLYVDNCVTSVDDYKSYMDFRSKTTQMMSEAGMDLRQWECSAEEGTDEDLTTSDTTNQTTVLGVIWDKEKDTLSCEIPSKPDLITKRKILSVLHQVFDPIGHLCPALLLPKVMLQKTWINKCDWDDMNLPQDIITGFDKWMGELPSLSEIKIPRQACYTEDVDSMQIHMFCDASQDAFAAAVYIRSETEDGVKIQLLQAKNRVAPLKKTTIPRLELLGCWMGANLTQTVKEALQIQECPTFYWTDSSTALAWIRQNDAWGTFVGNRVRKIIKVSQPESWRHIAGVHNPADLPSRGCSPSELLASRWWEGPSWLKKPKEYWPISEPVFDEEEIRRECKKSSRTAHEHISISLEKGEYSQEPRFSSYTKNVRVCGWIRRFLTNCRKQKNNVANADHLTIEEIRIAEKDLIRRIQKETMPANTDMIGGIPVEKIDDIYRVLTRLTNGKENMDFQKPILLPKKHALVEQLVTELHRTYSHAGIQFVMGKLRAKYWIPQPRRTVRSILRRCTTCRRWDANKMEVDPAALPEKRIAISEAFQTTGVDLAGPLLLKDRTKVWIVLYTCAVYRCVHLDLVTSLSTTAFIGSLERFINTEGRPNDIFSDNGTNFVGSANLLKEVNWEKMKIDIRAKSISWTFSPPTAAWWGGWWERLVRSIKDLLRRTLGKAKLTYDELRTALSAAAHTINGRPLTTVTEDKDDLIPLTPAMFLRGLPMTGFPEGDVVTPERLQQNYKMMRSLKIQFQTRFRNEYLSQLVNRSKQKEATPVKVGDIVLVGADNVKRFQWPLGRIVELLPGKDGKTRVAKVKTENGVLLRPLQRLYPLEVPNSKQIPVPTPEVKTKAATQKKFQTKEEEDINSKVDINVDVPVQTRAGRKIIKPSRYGDWRN